MVQELLLANSITLFSSNGLEFEWDRLWWAAPQCISTTPAYKHYFTRKCAHSRNLDPWSLAYLLRQYSQAECLEVKDRIYGMLSLADPLGMFPVRYEETKLQLVLRATLFFYPHITWFRDLVKLLDVKCSVALDTLEGVFTTLIEDSMFFPACTRCGVKFFGRSLYVNQLFRRSNSILLCLAPPGQISYAPRHLVVQRSDLEARKYSRCYGPIEGDCSIYEIGRQNGSLNTADFPLKRLEGRAGFLGWLINPNLPETKYSDEEYSALLHWRQRYRKVNNVEPSEAAPVDSARRLLLWYYGYMAARKSLRRNAHPHSQENLSLTSVASSSHDPSIV